MRCPPCVRILTLLLVRAFNWSFGSNLDNTHCGNNTSCSESSDEGSGGFSFTITHPVLDPLVDIIRGIEYTIILLNKEDDVQIDGIRLIVKESDSSNNNPAANTEITFNDSDSMNLSTPVYITWIPKTSITTCITLRLYILQENNTVSVVTKHLCKPKGCREYTQVNSYGYLASPGYPMRYPDNSNCTYILYSNSTLPLHVQFQDFKIEEAYEEECFDYVDIKYDLTEIRTCGSKRTDELEQMFFVSKNGFIQLTLVSDNKLVKNGFKVFYYVVKESDCNVTLNSTTGIIKSPNYPDIYFPNLYCLYKISLPDFYRITLHIQYLDLGDDIQGSCDSDNLTIATLENNSAENSLHLCKNEIKYSNQSLSYDSSASIVLLTFQTNFYSENRGFYLTYESFDSCKNQTFYGNSGGVSSVRFPSNYLNNQECFYNIQLLDESYVLELLFTVFHTESDSDAFIKGMQCNQDYLEIFENGESSRICGHWQNTESPLIIKSKTRSILFKFVTNSRNTKPGFYARWHAIETNSTLLDCETTWFEYDQYNFEIVREPRTWSESLQDCLSKGGFLASILNTETQRKIEAEIKLSVNCTLNLDAYWIGANDREYESDFFWSDGTRIDFKYWFPGWHEYDFANKQPSDDGLSDEDCVEIRQVFNYPFKGHGRTKEFWWNDRNCNVRNPYICQHYKQGVTVATPPGPVICNRTVFLTEDETFSVSSPNYPSNYPDQSDCHVTVVYPLGIHPRIHFEKFDLENEPSCDYDNLTLSSHPDDKEIKVYCGNWNRRLKLLQWTSATNFLFLNFRSDHSVTKSGFLAQISAADDIKCAEINSTNIQSSLNDKVPLLSGPEYCYASFLHDCQNHENSRRTCLNIGGELMKSISSRQTDFWISYFLYSSLARVNFSLWVGESSVDNITGAYCNAQSFFRLNSSDITVTSYERKLKSISCDTKLYFICQISQHKKVPLEYFERYTNSTGFISPLLDAQDTYLTNYDHTFVIKSEANNRIFLTLEYLDIEFQDDCIYDSLKIYGLMENKSYCGHLLERETPIYMLSVSNKVKVRFHSDSSVSAAGFKLAWKWIKADESFQYSIGADDTYHIQNLNFPLPYMDELKGCANLTAQNNFRVVFQIKQLIFKRYCNNINLNVFYKDDKALSICNSAAEKSEQLYEPIISDTNTLKLCLAAQSIETDEGFDAVYSFVQADDITLKRNIYFADDLNKTGIIHNLHYPDDAATKSCQIVHLNAPIGYNVVLTFEELNIDGNMNSKDTFLEISDNSLGNSNVYKLKNWTFLSKPSDSDFPVVIQSHLNRLVLKFVSGETGSKIYTATYRVVSDPEYLTKTRRYINGSIDSCDNDTCLNNGSCVMTPDKRYRCECKTQYTGFFCQIRWCELEPCVHGVCELTPDKYNCTCDEDYWGPECNLTKQDCNMVFCRGRGSCSGENQWNPTCTCISGWTGTTCALRTNDNSVPQKTLLGEPIWIGLIVILGLLFAFGLLFVFRRRCEGRFKCCDGPKQMISRREAKRQTNSNPVRTPSPSHNGLVDLKSNIPSLAIVVDEVKHMREKEKVSKESSPTASTPTVDSKNQGAAARLYASFRSNSSQYPTMAQNKTMLDPSMAVGGLVGGTLAFTDLDSENSMSEKVDERFILKPPPSSLDYKRRGRLALSKNKSQSENNSPASVSRIDVLEVGPKSRSLDSPSLHYYPDIVIINDDLRQVELSENQIEPEMIEMATLAVPPTIQNGQSEESEETEVSFTNLDASSKRKLFASKSRSECGIRHDEYIEGYTDRRNFSFPEVVPLSLSEYDSSEEIMPMSFETEYGIMIPKKHLDMQRAALSYDDLVFEQYLREEELRRNRGRLPTNVRSLGSLMDLRRYQNESLRNREDRYHRHRRRHHRSRHRDKYYITVNRRPSKDKSPESEPRGRYRQRSHSSSNSEFKKQSSSEHSRTADASSKRSNRYRRTPENTSSFENKNYVKSAHSKTLKTRRTVDSTDSSSEKDENMKRPVRKSRSNDLNLNSFSLLQQRDLKLMSEPDLLHRSQSQRRRRHSIHLPKVPLQLHPHPDDLLDQQDKNMETLNTHFSNASLLKGPKQISPEHEPESVPISGSDASKATTTFPSVTDTDTGVESISKSIYSSPRRNSKDEHTSVYKSELKVKDSAYQTNQSSIDRMTIESIPIIETLAEKRVPNGKRADDKKVYKQLEMAARKLAIFQSSVYKNRMSRDSAVNIVSEDEFIAEESDSSSRDHPPLRRTSASGLFPLFPLEQVSEEADVYTPESLSIGAHDSEDGNIYMNRTPTNAEEISEFHA